MITIFIRGGTIYRFPSMKIAEEWINENPEDYGFDKNNLEIFSTSALKDSIELISTLFIRKCNQCGSLVKFDKAPDEHIDNVVCPVCGNHLGPQK